MDKILGDSLSRQTTGMTLVEGSHDFELSGGLHR